MMQEIYTAQLSRQQFRELVKRITDISDEMNVDSHNKIIKCDVSDEELSSLMKEVAEQFGGLFPLAISDRVTPDTMEDIRNSFMAKFVKSYNDGNIVNDFFEGDFDAVLDHIYEGLTPHEIIKLNPQAAPEGYSYVFPTDTGYVCFHQLADDMPSAAYRNYGASEFEAVTYPEENDQENDDFE